MHGTKSAHRRRAARGAHGEPVDLLLTGHTHRPSWEVTPADGSSNARPVGRLNPGACWRAAPRTVALLDLPADGAGGAGRTPDASACTVRFLAVPRPG